jgi:HD-GYP domain-containing protein (c-di-GMP phosphodiesterase class II)
MAKKQVSETLTTQIENNQNSEIMETLTNAETAQTQEINETLTVEQLTEQIKNAKRSLSELNAKFDYDESNAEIIACETEISKLLAERKTLEKANEKLRLESLYNETLANAKNDIIAKFGITNELLETLIADAKNPDAKSTLIQSFNIVFGKKPLIVADGVTGKTLAKQNAKSDVSNGSFNITKTVKAMLTAGNSPDEIVSELLANTDMDETKAKKRLNDVRWGWEIENGLREKPSK